MRPLKGVVVRYGRASMDIKLESGNTVTTTLVKGIERGDVVEVNYDYTHGRVRNMRLAGTRKHSGPSEPFKPMRQLKTIPNPIDAPEGAFSLPKCEWEWEGEEGGEE